MKYFLRHKRGVALRQKNPSGIKFLPKNRAITLIEVLIGLGLVGILLSTLMIYLRKTARLQTQIEKAQTEIVSRAHLQTRLGQIFSHLAMQELPALYTEEEDFPSLHFFFDNGMDMEKAFSGIVKGMLFVQKGQLILEISSISLDFPIQTRKEVLYASIQSAEWNFFDWKDKQKLGTTWRKDETSLPCAIQINILKDNELFTFPFFLTLDYNLS